MIIDAFTFFNGLDMLEIRLNCLAPYVERFILVESPFNMVGKRKPLYFDENKERFKDFNITHLVVDDHEKHMGGWEPYYYQLDYMMKAFDNIHPDDIVLLSDFDEIPDLKNYHGEECGFKQKNYVYYLNVFSGKSNWKGTVATKNKNIRTFSRIRRRRGAVVGLYRGWHFTYVSSPEEIIDKIEAFCHQELNTSDIKARIAENKRNLVDPFNRGDNKFTVEMPSGPEWLLQNKEKYKHLFYGEICQ